MAQRVHPPLRSESEALAVREEGGSMATMGPEDRERFARREESTVVPVRPEPEPERQKSIKVVAGGSITEAICGAAVVVLAIIGLAGVLPGTLASIATIAFGVALLAQGSAI